MKRRISISFLYVIALFGYFMLNQLPLQAAEIVFSSPLGSATETAFQNVCKMISKSPIIRGSFVQTKTIARLNKQLISSGFFIIDTAEGILWETQKPYPSVMVVTAESVIQFVPGGKRTKLDAGGNETFTRFSQTIRTVFQGNSEMLREQFEIFFMIDPSDPERWTLGLIPAENTIRAFADRIVLSGKDIILSVTLFEPDGGAIRYDLSNHEFPGVLTENEKQLFSAQ